MRKGSDKHKLINKYYSARDLQRFYKMFYPNDPLAIRSGIDTFLKIHEIYSKVLMDYIVNGGIYELPYKLGKLYIQKRKTFFKNKYTIPRAFNRSIKKYIKVFNEHSSGFRGRFIWNKKHCNIKNYKYYSFIPYMCLKKACSRMMYKEGGYLNYTEGKKTRRFNGI